MASNTRTVLEPGVLVGLHAYFAVEDPACLVPQKHMCNPSFRQFSPTFGNKKDGDDFSNMDEDGVWDTYFTFDPYICSQCLSPAAIVSTVPESEVILF